MAECGWVDVGIPANSFELIKYNICSRLNIIKNTIDLRPPMLVSGERCGTLSITPSCRLGNNSHINLVGTTPNQVLHDAWGQKTIIKEIFINMVGKAHAIIRIACNKLLVQPVLIEISELCSG